MRSAAPSMGAVPAGLRYVDCAALQGGTAAMAEEFRLSLDQNRHSLSPGKKFAHGPLEDSWVRLQPRAGLEPATA